jgi:uncharacterized membrane protein YtjA (UPF0391 family)
MPQTAGNWRYLSDLDTTPIHCNLSRNRRRANAPYADHRPPLQCPRETTLGRTTLLIAVIVARRWGLSIMLRWALFFFIISIIAGLFGFTEISVATAGIARILFFIAIVVFLALLVLALLAGNTIL